MIHNRLLYFNLDKADKSVEMIFSFFISDVSNVNLVTTNYQDLEVLIHTMNNLKT